MLGVDLISLVFRALPKDIPPAHLQAFGKREWWTRRPDLALAYSLRKSARLNWQAYLENNPDVKASGLDPILHFLRAGLFEGRKLYSWSPLHERALPGAPKVSLVIPVHNKEAFLDKCIDSAINQTLSDIEIIIVDDASTDGSLAIIREYEKNDKRIKVIAKSVNEGTHRARQSGVAVSTGDYVTFLDSDDFLMHDGLAKAWSIVAKGYDIGVFELNTIDHTRKDSSRVSGRTRWFGKLTERAYSYNEKKEFGLGNNELPTFMWNKIFEGALARYAFSQMEPIYSILYEDKYEFLVLNHYARNLYRSREIVVNYVLSTGISTGRIAASVLENVEAHLAILPAFANFCKQHGYASIEKYFRKFVLNKVADWLKAVEKRQIPTYICTINKFFNYYELICAIYNNYKTNTFEISEIFSDYKINNNDLPITRIGMLFDRLEGGGIETTIRNICSVLNGYNYEITLFIYDKTTNEELISTLGQNIKVVYIAPHGGTDEQLLSHLLDLYRSLRQNKIQLLFHWWVHSPYNLWDAILCRLLGIDIMTSVRFDHNYDLLMRNHPYNHINIINTLKIYDKVTCLTHSADIYYKSQGINSVYLPNAPRHDPRPLPDAKPENNIAFLGRLGDCKKGVNEALAVVAKLLKTCPDALLIFIGGFEDANRQESFYKRIQSMGLSDNVQQLDWVPEPAAVLDKCKLMLMTSFMEGFPNSALDAQSRGLPIVMYALDVTIAIGNPAIVQVPQGDCEAAAREIARILQDDAYRAALSSSAVAKTASFSRDRFKNEMLDLFANYRTFSHLPQYDLADYQRAVRTMAFYAGKPYPAY